MQRWLYAAAGWTCGLSFLCAALGQPPAQEEYKPKVLGPSDEAVKAMQAGALSYLQKPVDAENLLEVIRRQF